MFPKLFVLSLLLSSITAYAMTITGTVTYDRPTPEHSLNTTTLNFNKTIKEVAKQVLVEAINDSGESIASTSTNDNGIYTFSNLPSDTNIKIRVYSKLLKNSGATQWNVKVVDNTNDYSVYVLEGDFYSTNTNTNRNLHATYTNRQAAPFAILGSVYEAMQKIITVKSTTVFPPLILNWSVNNIAASGNTELGQIGTSYYNGDGELYILGDDSGDADEYDNHIIIHEWTHYFEDKFGRADNIGGSHGNNDHLDIRVAFGEGLANASSAIVTDDPIYYDTSSSSHIGWNMNIESDTHETPGWFSEASIQRILYDFYDSNNDGDDTLTLGFKPLYDVLTGAQKTTKAFTSLFTFVTALKHENASNTGEIENIVSSENIATINDIYGSERLNNVTESALPLYNELTIDETFKEVCTSNTYGSYNKLNNHKYVRFTITENKSYPIRVEQNNGSNSDPDFVLFQTVPFKQIVQSDSSTFGLEEAIYTLDKGDYLLDINDAQNRSKSCFNVSVGEVTEKGTANSTSIGNSSVSSVGIALPENILLSILLLLGIAFLPALFIGKELKI